MNFMTMRKLGQTCLLLIITELAFLIDTIISKDLFSYTETGKIRSINSLTDSTRQIKIYNEMDSLIGDYNINQLGDTSFLTTNEYTKGKLTKSIHRRLSSKLPDDMKDFKEEDLRNYDTILFITEFIYSGDLVERSIIKDKKGNILNESHNTYEEGKLKKVETYSYLGSAKYISETTNYSYRGGEADFKTIDRQGMPIFSKRTTFQNDMKIVTNYSGETNSQSIWYYNKQNQLIRNVIVNLDEGTKQVYSYVYNKNGNLTEEISHNEKVNLNLF